MLMRLQQLIGPLPRADEARITASLLLLVRGRFGDGGRIWVKSDGAGRGSTFFFTLSQSQEAAPKERTEWTR